MNNFYTDRSSLTLQIYFENGMLKILNLLCHIQQVPVPTPIDNKK